MFFCVNVAAMFSAASCLIKLFIKYAIPMDLHLELTITQMLCMRMQKNIGICRFQCNILCRFQCNILIMIFDKSGYE